MHAISTAISETYAADTILRARQQRQARKGTRSRRTHTKINGGDDGKLGKQSCIQYMITPAMMQGAGITKSNGPVTGNDPQGEANAALRRAM